MLKPMTVWILSIIILKEKFNKSFIKYLISALLGLTLAKCDQDFSVQHLWFLISFLLFASLGAVTTRGYARRKKEAMQAIGTECLVFGLYGLIFLPIRGTLNFDFFTNPYIWTISLLAFVRHILLIVGVKRASSAVSIELFALSKPVFQLILGALLLNDIPSFYKILGVCIISLSLCGFWKIEKSLKKILTINSEAKSFKLLFYFSFLSCSGCDEEEEQSDPIIQPSIIEITIVPSISYEQANDPNFWKQYTIDQDSHIFPIIEKIKSDKWQDEKFEKFFVALTAFLSVKNNVSILNEYKNRTTFGKILFFVALAISDGENISKYENFFYQELVRRLQELHPDDWENILENPIKLEHVLRDIIVDDTIERNPRSKGRIVKYQTVKGTNYGPIVRRLVYVPKVTFRKDVELYFICKAINDNEKLQEELLRLRKDYLRTKQKPNIDGLMTDFNKILKIASFDEYNEEDLKKMNKKFREPLEKMLLDIKEKFEK